VLDHLFRYRLRSHKHTGDVHLEHGVRVLLAVIQCSCLLLDPGCRNQSVHPSLFLRNVGNNLVKLRHISDIDLAVVKRRTKLLCCPSLDPVEVVGRFAEAVKAVHWKDAMSVKVV